MVALICAVAGSGAILMVRNPAPAVPPISPADASGTTQPYVIKLHARWCPVCMVTKDAWTAVQAAYAGRVRMVVFDFTSAASTEASRAEAHRLNLDSVFEEYSGETGTVLVLDGASKAVRHVVHGHRDFADYRAAIEATLAEKRD